VPLKYWHETDASQCIRKPWAANLLILKAVWISSGKNCVGMLYRHFIKKVEYPGAVRTIARPCGYEWEYAARGGKEQEI